MCGPKEWEVTGYSVLNVAVRSMPLYKHTEFSVFIDSKYNLIFQLPRTLTSTIDGGGAVA
jgi:hypothetical protein